jgi:hypothetical protein
VTFFRVAPLRTQNSRSLCNSVSTALIAFIDQLHPQSKLGVAVYSRGVRTVFEPAVAARANKQEWRRRICLIAGDTAAATTATATTTNDGDVDVDGKGGNKGNGGGGGGDGGDGGVDKGSHNKAMNGGASRDASANTSSAVEETLNALSEWRDHCGERLNLLVVSAARDAFEHGNRWHVVTSRYLNDAMRDFLSIRRGCECSCDAR